MLKVSLMIDDDGVIDQKYLIKERNKNYPFFFPPFLTSRVDTTSISVRSLND